MKTACIFPGQGSQFVGMAKPLYESDSETKALFDSANGILGFDLVDVMFNGPEDRLRQTDHTQPAVFLHSIAVFRKAGIKPDMTAGHSLGEFTALVAAGALGLEDGLRLVHQRGKLMQEAGKQNPGTMAAVIGMADEKVVEICKQASEQSGKVVVPANYNCPGQLVISGFEEAIDKAIELLKEAGCKIAKKIPVGGAFHSPLMASAHEGLAKSLEAVNFTVPECPVYQNYSAAAETDPEILKKQVLEQLLNPVRWTETLQRMHADGAGRFVEIGPGKVLQGLVKRTLSDSQIEGLDQ